MRLRPTAAALALVLVSCSREPPAYESHYQPPPASTIAPVTSSARPMEPRIQPIEASFVDDFERPDTTLGLGDGWSMRGDVMDGDGVPPATDGFIRNGRFTYAGSSVAYASRRLRSEIQEMGTVGRFSTDGSSGETSLGMGISPDDTLTANAVIFTASRWGWQLRLRRASSFQPVVMKGEFSPPLEFDTDYQFDFEIAGRTITVRVPGSEVRRDAETGGLLGDNVFWSEYTEKPPAGIVFDFDTVWAIEDGQPLFMVE